MKKASQLFSSQQKAMIEQAIAEAERNTSGEIIPVVATVSGRYDRAEDLFGLLFALMALALGWWIYQQPGLFGGGWGGGAARVSLLPVIATIVAGFFVGVMLATWIPSLALPLIAKQEMQEEVERSAVEAFHRCRVRDTQGSTGILIYFSLYEHMVTVIGDSAINEKLQQSDWEDICRLAVQDVKQGTVAEALANTIDRCGRLLSQYFPAAPGDRNELKNELHLVD